MKQVKSLKHYLLIFVIATFAIFLFSTIDAIQNGSYDTQLLLTGAVAPGTFTILLFIFDKIFDLIFPKKLKKAKLNKSKKIPIEQIRKSQSRVNQTHNPYTHASGFNFSLNLTFFVQ